MTFNKSHSLSIFESFVGELIQPLWSESQLALALLVGFQHGIFGPKMGPKTTISQDEEVDYKTFCSHTNGQGEKWWQVSYDGSWGGLAVSEEKKRVCEKKSKEHLHLPLLGRNGISSHVAVRFFSLVLLIDYTVKIFNVALGIDSFIDREKDLSEIFKELSCSFKWEPLKKVAKNTFSMLMKEVANVFSIFLFPEKNSGFCRIWLRRFH